MVVQILLWLLLEKPAEKEQAPLLRMLRMCTSRDAVRFRDVELRELMMKLCGKESEGLTEIGWFYREYCIQCLLGLAGGAGGAGELRGARDVDHGDASVPCVPCMNERAR